MLFPVKVCSIQLSQSYFGTYGSEFVLPEHIQAIWHNILRHRIALSFEAQAEGISKDDVIDNLLSLVAIP